MTFVVNHKNNISNNYNYWMNDFRIHFQSKREIQMNSFIFFSGCYQLRPQLIEFRKNNE